MTNNIPIKPNLSQSLLKDYYDYYSNNACGYYIWQKHFLKLKTEPSLVQQLGIYFEYMATGYVRQGDEVPTPKMVYQGSSREDMAKAYKRADLSALLFKKMLTVHNVVIKKFGNYMLYNGASGITDIEAINDTFSEGLISIFADLLTLSTVFGVMLFVNWKVALATIIILPALLWFTRWFQEGVKRSYQEERSQIGRLNAFLQERITGMRIIQIFNAEAKEKKKFDEINGALRDANIKGIWYYSLFFPAVEVCSAIAIGCMVWMAAHEIIGGGTFNDNPLSKDGVGIISGFLLLISMLFRPLRFIADKVNVIQRGLVASERVFKLVDTDASIADKGTHVPTQVNGKLSFENVWFAYNGIDWVLKNVSFDLKEGETLAIVGATGSGKTSTISLLGRFYDIQKGSIKLDGTDIREYKLAALRSTMGVVLQDVFLFAGSVYENITLRNPDITREQVERAAKMVGAHGFISKLPGGYDYLVMERGATLSMGQRQLISFVRALVYNPQILILDEATSSIDSESESLIQHATEELVKGRTSIVIAHRLSTIRHAHKILVLDKGELKEFGTHQELLALNGYYKRLYDMQFAKRKEEAA